MNSGCESHYRAGGRDRHAVESNCVAARRGGEQLETEGWSRTKVNSIRHVRRASLLGQGEACRASGEQITVRELPRLESCRLGCGWSGNDWKGTWDKWRARLGSRREGSDAVRASIVAGKPDNSGGAKGRRKMKTLATVRDQTSSIAVRLETMERITCGSGRPRASGGHPGNGMPARARTRWTNILFTALVQYAINLPIVGSHQLESRMRENRLSDSEGGAAQQCAVPTPIIELLHDIRAQAHETDQRVSRKGRG